MNAKVDKSGCISCGLCEATCPEVFRMGDDGTAEAYTNPVPAGAESAAEEARDGCPVSVITVE